MDNKFDTSSINNPEAMQEKNNQGVDIHTMSKYTWANAPLDWHNFFSIAIWVGVAFLAVQIIFYTVLSFGTGILAQIVTWIYMGGIFSVHLILAINLRGFRPIAYRMLWISWELDILLYLLAIMLNLSEGTGVNTDDISSLVAVLIGGLPNIIYYRNRKSLFYSRPEDFAHLETIQFPCEVTGGNTNDESVTKQTSAASEEMKESDKQKCKHCGSILVEGASFCNICGEPVEDNEKEQVYLKDAEASREEILDPCRKVEEKTEKKANNNTNMNIDLTDHQLDQVYKWKALLDDGIITQSEFDEKKKEILKF